MAWHRHAAKPCCKATVRPCTATRGICDDLARDGGQDGFCWMG